MITAPYNFVPLNKEVFYPSWSEEVSHDVPFEDGESGEIGITITAKSPIFIRNHSEDKEKPSVEFCHFINENGAKEFYIPGSSIKGMIRSVLEIMSFSKIIIDEDRLKKPISVRDMTNQKELVGTANGCGFLVKHGNAYQLEDSGKILAISHIDLQSMCPKIKKFETAKAKYNEFGTKQVTYKTFTKMMDVKGKQIPKEMAKMDNASNQKGILVFSGDIGNKKHEFIFKSSTQKISLDTSVFQDFSKAYFENEGSVDGQYWKEKFKLPNTKIPIFYEKNRDGKIIAIGLTQLFKLSYTKTFFDAAKQNSKPNQLDLVQTIFGYHKDQLALKGRVQFSHFKSTTERYEQQQVDAILGSPNPTYYPSYIRQYGQTGKIVKYKTLMDSDAQISGWKRYPLHSEIMPSGESSDKEKVKTHFKPLPKETVFKGKLRFHNLTKAEIGALLSAITFHGQSDKYMHNIGMAKPLGYGKIEITLDTFKYFDKLNKNNQQEYMHAFEEEISKEILNWKSTPQLKELFAMASVNCKPNQQLEYQLLENPNPKYELNKRNPEKNDFTGAKKEKEYLVSHSGTEYKTETLKVDKIEHKKEIQKIKPAIQNDEKIKIATTTALEQIYQVYDGNILQVYNAFKNGHLVKYKFNEKALAKKLYVDMKQDENLSKSQKLKDMERFEFLKKYL